MGILLMQGSLITTTVTIGILIGAYFKDPPTISFQI